MEPLLETPSIKSWLKKVVSTNKKNTKSPDVFSVPLYESLQIANTHIAYEDRNTIIGSIPIVVAKCGSFLKDQGLYVEGVFRKSGSAKRLGELQHHFNSSSDFGIGLSWRGYTVHDAANCLRRFLNYLPEPVIIFRLYEPFRTIASKHANDDDHHHHDNKKVLIINEYQGLIDQLPIVNQYLLFYLLDLLALFTRYAKYTKMNSMALASVFTPGILLNPDHSMSPEHYKLSQRVVQFLIENQEHFHLPQSTLKNTALTPTIDSHTMRQQLLRANTVPAKVNRFGPNDPLQIVNK
ncbi:Rho GTPase activation protein [Mucor mucedo]|uniref:Rho GTPase activation protein n=1 Tax=Mucor mucedo TaxID=29922 RepID=UPI0022200220|nr:Rho GTPase activation protein [Mucor mucedo]KAI7890177.1 Rho GTPase activation protein [Mucor mucedo]